MRSKNLNAIILSRKDIGEADRLISAFSLEEGKIKIIARGSRKIKSKMASHIEPFTVGKYQLIPGKSFYILTGAEKKYYNEKLSSNIDFYRDASYLCEIVELTMNEGEPERTLYELLEKMLKKITEIEPPKRELGLRLFEFKLLGRLGYDPNYSKCLRCGSDIKEKKNYLGGFEGIYCHLCTGSGKKIDKNTLKILRLFKKESLENILKIRDIEKHNRKLKEMTVPYLYDILPRPPKSYEF